MKSKVRAFVENTAVHLRTTILLLGMIAILGACAVPPKPTVKTVVTEQPVAVEFKTIPPKVESIKSDNIRRLLVLAEDALVAKRFTTPVHDNAFDRYQAVLMMDPENRQAHSGLQSIFATYASSTRSAIRRGDLSKARSSLELARFVDSRSAELPQLSKELADAQRRQAPIASTTKKTAVIKNDKEVFIDENSLTKRDDQLVSQLQTLAIDIKEKDESVLIYARNDAEGRWIYKKMAEAVLGYRLRGDMRIGKKPKIEIHPPID